MLTDTLEWIAGVTGAKAARRGARIQSLWSGYGEIFRVELVGAEAASVIVKWVRPPAPGRREDVSHARKCRSYEVERVFYLRFARRCGETCRVPRFHGERTHGGESIFVLEDLDASGYPERRHGLAPAETELCLAWLASFHAEFLGERPEGLWKTGTYWHLATRQGELAAMAPHDPLRQAAAAIDARLRAARFQTFVHGDAKPANFCFGPRRGPGRVAAVDFQYVGGGCGMKDVAYLLDRSAREERDLDRYFEHLRHALAVRHPDVDAAALEVEWRDLYPFARDDYHRFLAGWLKGRG